MAWTLEYNGSEQTLEAWGFSAAQFEAHFVHQGIDTFRLRMPVATATADPVIPFEGRVIIRRDRTAAGGGTFTGGSIEFSGKRLLALQAETGAEAAVVYDFGGPWYDIDACGYQQTNKVYDGDPDNLVDVTHSEVVLFQKVTALDTTVKRNSGEQITDILQHILDVYTAQSLTAPFQIGTIGPAVNLPTYEARDIKCSEAINLCLRSSPDAVLWFDYSTSPPTVNVTKRASMSAVSLAVRDSSANTGFEITPRPDLQARGVVIHFKSHNTADGFTWIQTTKQTAETSPGNPGPEAGLRVIVQTVDLAGSSRQDVSGSVTVAAVANTRAWWQRFVPELQSRRIRGFSVGSMTVKNEETGATVSLDDYPNVILDGQVEAWMRIEDTPVDVVRAVVSADATYDQWDVDAEAGDVEVKTNGMKLETFPRKPLTARVTLTNSPTASYSAIAEYISGEEVPSGMAQAIYDALSTLQYQGTISFVGADSLTTPRPGKKLNLTGGAAAWSSMNAIVQEVTCDYGHGRTAVTIGPAAHLSAGDLTQLFLINRNRRILFDASTAASAKASGGGGTISLGQNIAKENTQGGWPDRKLSTVLGPDVAGVRNSIQSNGTDGQVILRAVDSSGAQSGTGSILLKLSEASGKEVKLRWFYFKDANNSCAPMKMLVLCSEAESDA